MYEKGLFEYCKDKLIMAALDQALITRSIEARVYHTRQDPRSRMYKDDPETV